MKLRAYFLIISSLRLRRRRGKQNHNPDTTELSMTDASDASDNAVNDDGETCVEGDTAQWGAIRCEPAQTFFADDLSQASETVSTKGSCMQRMSGAITVHSSIGSWVQTTKQAWPLSTRFVRDAKRGAIGTRLSCLQHHTREDGEHNLLSYLRVGQEVIANDQPMGTRWT